MYIKLKLQGASNIVKLCVIIIELVLNLVYSDSVVDTGILCFRCFSVCRCRSLLGGLQVAFEPHQKAVSNVDVALGYLEKDIVFHFKLCVLFCFYTFIAVSLCQLQACVCIHGTDVKCL